jgi:hypothetical protein
MADRDGGLIFDAGMLTVEEYLDRWLADSVGDGADLYLRTPRADNPGAPSPHTLGRVKFKTLTSAYVRTLHHEKLDAGARADTVHKIHPTPHKALFGAVWDGLMLRNAAGPGERDSLALPYRHRHSGSDPGSNGIFG